MEGGEAVVAGQQSDIKMTGETMTEAQNKDPTLGGGGDDGDCCRICRGEATDESPLFYPCKCSGSIKFVHQDCLMEWLSHSQKKYCDLCKTPFRFTKLYDHAMPQTLPMPVFLSQLCLHAIRNAIRWIRYLLVGLVWLCWLPWSIRQIWRGFFWLADGSWGSPTNSNGNVKLVPNSTSIPGHVPGLKLNTTEDVVNALPQITGSLSGFFTYSSSDFLLVKIVRYLYPSLLNWSAALTSSEPLNRTILSDESGRLPSFLSDVRYLKTLTSYDTINNSIIDVLEGQLICLLVVTAFILIFLIREWVINQQPLLDAPLDNEAGEARVAAAGDGGLRGPARRRRRRLVEDGAEDRVRRIAVPRPHRRIAAPNAAANAANASPAEERPSAQNSNSLAMQETTSPISEGADRETVAEERLGIHQSGQTAVRPTMHARNARGDAASIRRSIEEAGPSSTSLEWPGLEIFRDLWNRADGEPTEVLRIIREENRQDELGWVVLQMEKLQRQNHQSSRNPENGSSTIGGEHGVEMNAQESTSENSDQDTASMEWVLFPSRSRWARNTQTQPVEGIGPTHPPMEHTGISSQEILEAVEPDSNADAAPDRPQSAPVSPQETDAPSAANMGVGEDVSSTAAAEEATTQPQANNPNGPTMAVERIADWLWRTDGYVPEIDDQSSSDDENRVEDIDLGAPFVPIAQANVELDAEDEEDEPEAEEEQDPEVIAAAVAAGIDLNNQEAIEDAEDLDGILELIGMQGPLAGMVQNVIFSEVLITLTLAASVGLPYVWGKIALLLVANPIGAFVWAPLHLLSNIGNILVDIALFISGIGIYVMSHVLQFLFYLASLARPISGSGTNTASISKMSLSLILGSGIRLEKAIFGAVVGFKPDLPAFSATSHQALHVFRHRMVMDMETMGQFLVYLFYDAPLKIRDCFQPGSGISKSKVWEVWCVMAASCRQGLSNIGTLYQGLVNLRSLKPGVEASPGADSLDYSLVGWNTQDRIVAIIIGYLFFASLGYLYIKTSRLLSGLKREEKVEGVVADSLSQAGGVTKVILIIGIEMIVFPLYCGLLLDVALMPLFEGVGFQSRLTFIMKAPMTAFFVHWFVGTCYMFHFALFVSMCRKIMRRGVLYFIRDPDDPTFHPVRDVLERPIAIQLSKIAFSALVYGGLVILCLGGIVWAVSKVAGIFPIHWTSIEPILEFPVDLLAYNFLLPILIRSVEPSKKLNAMYEWWFRKCARQLRLTSFLFDEQKQDEQGRHIHRTWSSLFRRKRGDIDRPVIGEDRRILAEDRQLETYFLRDGTFVRAPGSDSVRITKGSRVFLEVDENNKRVDGLDDEDDGPHGRSNSQFLKVYIPPMFRARIAAFVALIWAFAAVTGIAFTIVPLTIGRRVIQQIAQSSDPPNDLYAFSVGLYLCGALAYAFSYYRTCQQWILEKVEHHFMDTQRALPRLWSSLTYCLGLAYLGFLFGVILPFSFSAVVEFYFVAPLYTYLASGENHDRPHLLPTLPPTIHLVQTWTLGLVYLRLILRWAMNYPHPQTRAATAIRSILREGFIRPDVRLATRAFILPSLVVTTLLLCLPLGLGWTMNAILQEQRLQGKIYRYAYPGILAAALVLYCGLLLKQQVGVWRIRIRDDVYLIGETLHNFGESQRRQNKGKGNAKGRDRAVSERVQIQ